MRIQARSSAFLLLISSCCLAPVAAKADTFAFTIHATQPSQTGVYLTSAGTLTTTPDATVAGALDITSITGTVNNAAIAGIVPVTPSGMVSFPDTFYFYYDNLLFPSATESFDGNGLAFTDVNGVDYIVGSDGSGLLYESFDGNLSFDQQTYLGLPANVTLVDETTVTPEPSSLLLLGTGLLGMTALLRRRIA